MKPAPKCVIDRSRSCNSCIAPDPRSCPYPYLLAETRPEQPPERRPEDLPTAPPPARDA